MQAQDHLSEIDAATGDGDHGINMAKGFRLVLARLEGKSFDLAQGFATIGDTLLGDIGGSMGPLYGSFFTEMADAIQGQAELGRDKFVVMLRAGEAAIIDLGEAKPGDKTLIDVLTPARRPTRTRPNGARTSPPALRHSPARRPRGWRRRVGWWRSSAGPAGSASARAGCWMPARLLRPHSSHAGGRPRPAPHDLIQERPMDTMTTNPTTPAASLPAKMMAVVAYEPGDYRLEQVDVPRAGPDDIIIEVEACGICASDIKTFQGAPSFWGDNKGQPRYVRAPMIPGHEFLGRAVEVGANVAAAGVYKVGDRLISEQIVPCEHCRYCKRGEYWMCEKHDVYGFQNNVNGGMAKYMRFPKESRTHRVPDSIPMERAVLVEPYACSCMRSIEG